MKHTKLIIAIAMVALIATTPVFAKGHGNGKNPNPQKMMDTRGNGCSCANCQMMNQRMSNDPAGNGMQNFGHHGFDRAGKMGGVKNASLMGTIKSIDTAKNTIVVTDVDGKDSTVHVNPQTRIAICTNTNTGTGTITSADLSALNKNDWVQISKFETNTTILEAHQIRVVR